MMGCFIFMPKKKATKKPAPSSKKNSKGKSSKAPMKNTKKKSKK